MDPRRKALVAVVTGSTLGIAGLVVTALPASAGDAPALPPVDADSLVQSAITSETPALAGTVEVTNSLGLSNLSMIPGAGALNVTSAEIYHDGAERGKVALHRGSAQETIVRNGTTVWDYKSQNNTATKYTIPADAMEKAKKGAEQLDPTAAASQLLAKAKESSIVSVDGTARIAGRAAYELVLTPKPTERTVLREIRVAVDSETKVPLRLEVLTNGTAEPALRIGFTKIDFASQPESEFTFTPPKNATVVEGKQPELDAKTQNELSQAQEATKLVGDGWDTVVVGKVPAELQKKQSGGTNNGTQSGIDAQGLISRLGKPVAGAWGSGHLFTTKIGSAIITDDGRFAAGAVPEQVLFEALGTK